MNSEVLSRRMLPSQLEGDFSIVIGGPLFQALRRTHLTGDALELTRRRVVVVAMIVWVPLLVLLAVDRTAWGSAGGVPLLSDIDAHARVSAELLLIAVVYGVGILVAWGLYGALGTPTWYATPDDGALRPQLAGWWYRLVSLSLF